MSEPNETEWGDIHDDYTRFVIDSRPEIERTLRSLKNDRELITAHFSNNILLTCILEVAEDEVILDDQPNRELAQRLLASKGVLFEGMLHRVKIKFRADRVDEVSYEGAKAYRIPFPDSLLKLQRREHFRVPGPMANPIKCHIFPPEQVRIEVAVVDLSVGGIGILSHGADTDLAPGEHYGDCRLLLPGQEPIPVAIEVCNTMDVMLRSGARVKRTGCRFLNLHPKTEILLQRFILQMERERLTRLN